MRDKCNANDARYTPTVPLSLPLWPSQSTVKREIYICARTRRATRHRPRTAHCRMIVEPQAGRPAPDAFRSKGGERERPPPVHDKAQSTVVHVHHVPQQQEMRDMTREREGLAPPGWLPACTRSASGRAKARGSGSGALGRQLQGGRCRSRENARRRTDTRTRLATACYTRKHTHTLPRSTLVQKCHPRIN